MRIKTLKVAGAIVMCGTLFGSGCLGYGGGVFRQALREAAIQAGLEFVFDQADGSADVLPGGGVLTAQ